MRKVFLLLLLSPLLLHAQTPDCTFKPAVFTVHFGTGNVADLNAEAPPGYRRITFDCPGDGHYTYAPYTSDCFGGDWHTLAEDHTPGDAAGNMMIVNAGWSGGPFLSTTVSSLKGGTTYEFGAWMMNVCKPSDKCPFPLLPNISITLQTPEGRLVAQFNTGELERRTAPRWQQYTGLFTTPSASLILTMADNSPGGCGNDFVLDDITFRECVKPPPAVSTVLKTPAVLKPKPSTNPVVKKAPQASAKRERITAIAKPQTTAVSPVMPAIKQKPVSLPPPPPQLAARDNPLVKRLQTGAGEIKLDLYDNGEIDGDTVSIYHNNVLLVSKAGLAKKPISFRIVVDAAHPHHELVMVAENLGSIPPNTSLMIVTTAKDRYEVFISSTEQKNAKLVIDLKE